MCQEAKSSQSCHSLDQGTSTSVMKVKGQQECAHSTHMHQYTGIHNAFGIMNYTQFFYRAMECTWIYANTNTQWLLGGLWEMFMHWLGSRCSCGVCLGSGGDFWPSTAAELTVTLRVSERLTPRSDPFPFPLCQFAFCSTCCQTTSLSLSAYN